MNAVRDMKWLVVLLLAGVLPLTGGAAELPDDSYYQLDVMLEPHVGEQARFATLQGSPVIVSMFYGSCPHVCPMIISTIQQVEKQLPGKIRGELRVVMISIDPERDTPEALRAVAAKHSVDDARWMLARTEPEDTRALAAVLGIKYKALPDGQFNHTSTMILLDAAGREIARSSKLGAPDENFVQQVATAFTAD